MEGEKGTCSPSILEQMTVRTQTQPFPLSLSFTHTLTQSAQTLQLVWKTESFPLLLAFSPSCSLHAPLFLLLPSRYFLNTLWWQHWERVKWGCLSQMHTPLEVLAYDTLSHTHTQTHAYKYFLWVLFLMYRGHHLWPKTTYSQKNLQSLWLRPGRSQNPSMDPVCKGLLFLSNLCQSVLLLPSYTQQKCHTKEVKTTHQWDICHFLDL